VSERLRSIVERLGIRPGGRVLEIGGGEVRAFFDEPR